MRFLLHPLNTRTVRSNLKSRATKQSTVGSRIPIVSDTCRVNLAGNADDDTLNLRWGQQCSPNCGCVVRFEAVLDKETSIVQSAVYHAKSLVAVTEGNRRDGTLDPVRTTRTGRLMLRQSTCESLHYLSRAVTDFMVGKNMTRLKQEWDFQSIRSSPAFRRTALKQQGLPNTSTHCFDVVEEAATALIRGYMPRPRQGVASDVVFCAESPQRHDEEKIPLLDDPEPAFPFGSLWKYDPVVKFPSASSALSLFDESQNREHVNERKPSKRFKPTDWVSYVDAMQEEEKQESA